MMLEKIIILKIPKITIFMMKRPLLAPKPFENIVRRPAARRQLRRASIKNIEERLVEYISYSLKGIRRHHWAVSNFAQELKSWGKFAPFW